MSRGFSQRLSTAKRRTERLAALGVDGYEARAWLAGVAVRNSQKLPRNTRKKRKKISFQINSFAPFSAPPRLCERDHGLPSISGRKFTLANGVAQFQHKSCWIYLGVFGENLGRSGPFWGREKRISCERRGLMIEAACGSGGVEAVATPRTGGTPVALFAAAPPR